MDCFYAAVEMKHNPQLRGKPIAIGGPPDSRSVLCTASYEARKFNVRAAMPSATAVRLCPQLILVPPHFDLYRKESHAVQEIFHRYTQIVEPLSLDEAYLDVTDSSHCGGSATLIAKEIRATIEKECSLTASAGIAPNKFLAKVASDWNKPNGQFVIRPHEVEKFVRELKVEKIHGVGKVTAKKMHALGMRSCADIQNQSVEQLVEWFGSSGRYYANVARGIDERVVEPHSERRSLTVEETFHRDIFTLEECLGVIPHLYAEWEGRMSKGDYSERIRGYVVKVKFFDFKGTTHEVTASHWPSEIDFAELLKKAWNRRQKPVRLIGLGVRLVGSKEESVDEPSLQEKRPWQFSFPL